MKNWRIVLTIFAVILALTWSFPVDDDYDETLEDESEEQEDDVSPAPIQTLQSYTTSTTTTRPPHTVYHHNETGQSYTILTSGPCINNLWFLPATSKLDEQFGECGCHQLKPMGSVDHVPLVYHYSTEKCYYLYRQGYCKKESQWLVYTSQDQVECSDNPCVNSGLDPEKVVWYDRKCVELSDPCSSESGKSVIAFKKYDVVPTCTDPIVTNSTISVANDIKDVERLGCPIGQRPIPNGQCIKVYVLG